MPIRRDDKAAGKHGKNVSASLVQEPLDHRNAAAALKVMHKLAIWLTALITLLLCSAYSNTFRSPPVLDDFHSFVFEENVHKDLSTTSLKGLSRSVFGVQRWIPMVTFSLDFSLGNGEIFYFHLTNLLIHLTCTLAVLFLALNLLKTEVENRRSLAISPILCAFWVAGLWALNPVQTNAVTYLVQRMASIQALFFISSVGFYVLARRRHRQAQKVTRGLPFYLACSVTAVGAFLSKENSAMLPVILLVTEIWFFTPELPTLIWHRLRAASLAHKTVILLAGLLLLYLGTRTLQDLAAGYANRHFTMLERLLTEARVVVWYLSLLVWPAPSRLSLEHDVIVSTSFLNPLTTLPAVFFLVLLGWLLLRYRRSLPLITYGGVWYFLNLVIESSFVPLELVFEHRLYLPSVGFSLAVVCVMAEGLQHLFKKRPVKDLALISTCGFAVLFSVLTLLTYARNEAWSDRVTIYEDAARKAPNHPRARANLAVAYAQAERYEEAIREAEVALGLGRNRQEASVVAGNAILGSLSSLERYEDVILRADAILKNLPEHFDAGGLNKVFLNVAQANLRLGKLNEAFAAAGQAFHYSQRSKNAVYETRLVEGMFFKIVKDAADKHFDLDQNGIDDPGASTIPTWIAKDFLQRGARERAKSLLGSAVVENPADAEAVVLLETLMREDTLNYAQNTRENTKQTYQSSPFSRFNASMALAYLARTPGWSGYFRSVGEKLLDYALEIQPGVADAHLLKAYYVHDRKEIEPAIEATERALALDPDYARAWLALGYFRMELNDFPGAVTAFKRGLELYPGCPQRASVLAAITAIEQNPALTTAQN